MVNTGSSQVQSQTALAKADTVPRNVEGLLQVIIKFNQSLESAILQHKLPAMLVTERKKGGWTRQKLNSDCTDEAR